jgi:hypothetical protein
VFISWALHFFNGICVWLLIIAGGQKESENNTMNRNIKQKNQIRIFNWHFFMFVFVYKFIVILSNHTIDGILCNNLILQIGSSIIIYSTYLHTTGHTNLNTKKYIIVLLTCIIIIFFNFIINNHNGKNKLNKITKNI